MQVRLIVQISYIFEEHKLFQQNTKSIINTSNIHVYYRTLIIIHLYVRKRQDITQSNESVLSV